MSWWNSSSVHVLQQDFCLFYIFFHGKLQWGLYILLGLFFLFFLLLASKTCISPFYWLYVTFICNKQRIPLSLGWIVSNVMYSIHSIVLLKFNLSSMPTIPPQLLIKTCFESEAECAVHSACDWRTIQWWFWNGMCLVFCLITLMWFWSGVCLAFCIISYLILDRSVPCLLHNFWCDSAAECALLTA
jgi:hypothetical protein